MKEAEFLGKILASSELFFPVLYKVMKKHGIDDLNPEEGGVTERLLDQVENPNKIDWKAVRQDIEQEIRNMPDVLPAELAAFQEIMEGKKSLPSPFHRAKDATAR
jgi:hypothetical protein